MQVWRSTRTMPSARFIDAPVGQTSTQGGLAQCWHIIGRVVTRPLRRSTSSILRIHCEFWRGSGSCSLTPFSSWQASMHLVQPGAHLVASIKRPQRTAGDAAVPAGRAAALASPTAIRCRPGAMAVKPRPATPAPAAAMKARRGLRSGVLAAAGLSALTRASRALACAETSLSLVFMASILRP